MPHENRPFSQQRKRKERAPVLTCSKCHWTGRTSGQGAHPRCPACFQPIGNWYQPELHSRLQVERKSKHAGQKQRPFLRG